MTWFDDVIIASCVNPNLSAYHSVSESPDVRMQSRELAEQQMKRSTRVESKKP